MVVRFGLLVLACGLVFVVGCTRRCCEVKAAEQSIAADSGEGGRVGAKSSADGKKKDKSNKDKPKKDKPKKDKTAEWALEDMKALQKEAKLQRGVELSRLKLDQSKTEVHISTMKKKNALERAQRAYDVQLENFKKFREFEVPSRISWAELRLQRSVDGVAESREELEQLEQMYAGDDFADGTKEIVLERGRRRLERSERDLELRRKDHEVLVGQTIPLETREHEIKLEEKQNSLEIARLEYQQAKGMDERIKELQAIGAVKDAEDGLMAHREEQSKKVRERDEE